MKQSYPKQQAEAVTQERFDRLPALLTAYQVKLVTGLSDHDLKAFVGDGVIEARRAPVRSGCQRAYAKYTKASVGRLAGYVDVERGLLCGQADRRHKGGEKGNGCEWLVHDPAIVLRGCGN